MSVHCNHGWTLRLCNMIVHHFFSISTINHMAYTVNCDWSLGNIGRRYDFSFSIWQSTYDFWVMMSSNPSKNTKIDSLLGWVASTDFIICAYNPWSIVSLCSNSYARNRWVFSSASSSSFWFFKYSFITSVSWPFSPRHGCTTLTATPLNVEVYPLCANTGLGPLNTADNST